MNIADGTHKGFHVIESLSPHQLESGMVTQHELDMARRWSDSITAPEDTGWLDGWLGQDYPFSFKYAESANTDQVFTSDSLAQGITIAINSAPGAELIQYERIH
ncbi:MAG: hypothetical protein M1546_14455 [Chloroflexi bacterium]|nr:hypothetical protein [Chloroflexota bacterium]